VLRVFKIGGMVVGTVGRRRIARRALLRCALLALAVAMPAARAPAADAAPRIGEAAPALVLPLLDGHVFDLAALRGRVVVVNFWASWCSPCRAEMPQLDAFYRRHHAQGLELLGLSVDDPQDRATVVQIMKSFSYPAGLAAAAKVNEFGEPVAVPMTWIIDAKGVVRARLVAGNAVTLQTLSQTVLPLLPQPPAPRVP
jgi:thiol-disulfide isomerase/thioredoxin